ncbi:GAF and ANTAR domain-containing protein [Arthrobacter crystallopoietes]|uniref:GAF domain-containing protein n=1 Tax=Crystallibacter crystallopoietes TaxID=37928 RepID=A0A1H0ZU36_9MICC|nr:GAF and ANTAR domain-containing protein [Arthrobacter crystallopoietes]AUI51814.1 hypothetical protein AC20117_14480 [Arthrobacter crystallopoietes]SDQ30928.1 GAF domain-containing protein [Arthrobacter crystallopoietes]
MTDTPNSVSEAGILEYLQDLVLNSSDVEEFLDELARFSAVMLSVPGGTRYCGITLVRRKRAVTIASSDGNARILDELQNTFGDGPCLTAIREKEWVLVPDVGAERRWPEYMAVCADHNVGSILGIPFDLDGEGEAALNLYAGTADAFSVDTIDRIAEYVRTASKALNLSVRMAHLSDARDNLKAAMESRTTIDLAMGVIMGQNHCSQDAAFKILRNASSARNVKLREIAASIVATLNQGGKAETRFDE